MTISQAQRCNRMPSLRLPPVVQDRHFKRFLGPGFRFVIAKLTGHEYCFQAEKKAAYEEFYFIFMEICLIIKRSLYCDMNNIHNVTFYIKLHRKGEIDRLFFFLVTVAYELYHIAIRNNHNRRDN